jgi:hypothetical protein
MKRKARKMKKAGKPLAKPKARTLGTLYVQWYEAAPTIARIFCAGEDFAIADIDADGPGEAGRKLALFGWRVRGWQRCEYGYESTLRRVIGKKKGGGR